MPMKRGPLSGLRVIEVAGLGPVPFCGMMLADMGAEVVLVERPAGGLGSTKTALERNRRRMAIDLKQPAGIEILLELVARSDALIEGYRPGVAERMGWGPEVCLQRNNKLVFGRVTGWGREGPWAAKAGHDINYLSLNGVQQTIGTSEGTPIPPMNYVGDFGGGGMLLAYGLVCALFAVRGGAPGQVVDAAMIDGSALFMAPFMSAAGNPWGFQSTPGASLLAGGAPYYGNYLTADGRYLSVGAIEPQFYRAFLSGLDLLEPAMENAGYPALDDQTRTSVWPVARQRIAERIRSRSQAHWLEVFAAIDACVSPVLPLDEALDHPQIRARGTFIAVGGEMQPAPAPRFSGTPTAIPTRAVDPASDTEAILREWGINSSIVNRARAAAAFGGAET